ncbi:MAG TPA: ABC transporter substrate-binding protein [Pelomicrobium sp.]|nr:ABC transporter substrate-binding protein [Pelomicrobium sp.]
MLLALVSAACGSPPWNNPYPASQSGQNILYSSFSERPKHLDPVQAYAENEFVFIANIYQPPLQYHYFKRPFELIPFAAEQVPVPAYYDAAGRRLPADADAAQVAETVYEIRIRPGLTYQPHPALARDASGRPRYLALAAADLRGRSRLADFEHTGTREVTAEDYAYQIRRLAHPRLHSPILGLMSQHIVGLAEYAEALRKAHPGPGRDFVDLYQAPLAGVEVVDRYTYRIRIKGKYRQFVFWLAMPFFSPVPVEADRFYAQPGMAENNISLDWYPVGSGPYMLTENNPNRRMILERNPNFPGEPFPREGEPGDAAAGLLDDAGKTMPFIDKVVFSLEKESIPYWNKFLQGWYDASGIASDTFDQAVQFGAGGEVTLTDEMQAKGIQLQTSVATSVFYMGFNMLDPVVGGTGERGRKLRQAISIAFDVEEFISIFLNGRGLPGQGPIPPGIFGHRDGREGVNPYVYDWADGAPRRKPLAEARRLLAEAGYPDGRDAETGKPLILNFDTTARGPGDKSRLDWIKRQFDKLGVQLVIRATDYNRFQDKVRSGAAQMFFYGWNADYPDPENFFFLLNGAEASAKTGGNGVNYSNYDNAEFNRLFEQMKNMHNGAERQAVIDRMLAIVRRDAPWLYFFYPKDYGLQHAWMKNRKPNQMANNGLKYQRLDTELREIRRRDWNEPVVWPLALLGGLLAASLVPAVLLHRRRERATAKAGAVPG